MPPIAARLDDSLRYQREARRLLRRERRVGMLGEQDLRAHGQGAAEAQAQPRRTGGSTPL